MENIITPIEKVLYTAHTHTTGGRDGAAKSYALRARLNIGLPGLDRETAQTVIGTAHQTCPYSKSTRGNIDVTLNLI